MPGYRPPSTEPRGKWARAIHAKRRALDISQQRGFEVLGERLGFGPKSRTAYIALDMGTRLPTEAEAKVLAEWLGGYPEDDLAGTETATPSVPADLASAIRELVAELRAAREERNSIEERLRALEAAAMLRGQSNDGAHQERPAPHQTRG